MPLEEVPLRDVVAPRTVLEHRRIHEGKVFDLDGDVVDLGDTQVLRLPDEFNVDASNGLVGELRVLLGPDAIAA